MIANLQMYDWPEMADAYGRYWGRIRDRLRLAAVAAPDALSFYEDESHAWLREDLLLSQACGLPYRRHLHDKVQLVGTPDYGIPGCPPGYYCSVFVVRRGEDSASVSSFADSRFICNHRGSQSGYAAPLAFAADNGFSFSQLHESGGHRLSAKRVAEGTADITCVDAVSWRFMERFDAFAGELEVIDSTAATPGLPYISALANDCELLFNAVKSAIAQLDDEDRRTLGLRSLVTIPAEEYLAVKDPESTETVLGS